MVITNSGPLIALAKLGFLDILGRLYEKVMMPRAVYNDIWIAEGLCRSVLERLMNGNNG